MKSLQIFAILFLSITLVSAGIFDFLDSKKEGSNVVRTLQTDTTCIDGKCVAVGYLNQVNIEYNGEFIPVEDFLEVEFEVDKLKFKTLDDRECEFELDYEKVNFNDVANPYAIINEYRGGYYFITDVLVDVSSMNYKIKCEGFDLSFENNRFWMDEFFIDFSQAESEQNISTYYNKEDNILEFSILDGKTGSLSMIDPTTGVGFGGIAEDDDAVGTAIWNNPNNIKVDDSNYAHSSGQNVQSHYLKATNFGFSITGGASVDGIEVKIKRQQIESVPPNGVFDNAVRLVDGGGSVVGDNNADVNEWIEFAGTEVVTYGGSADTWSAGLDDTDVNHANFGVVLTADFIRAFGGTPVGRVYYITVEVTYSGGEPENCWTDTGTYIFIPDGCVYEILNGEVG